MHPVARAALAVAAIVVTVTFFGLCAFDRASIDDYWIAAQVRDEGLLGAQALWYTGWHGKFSSMLAMSTFAWVVDIGDQYWLAPALLLTAMWAACVSIVRVLAPAQGWRATLGVASVLFAFWVSQVPEPQESIYWLTGAYAYQFGSVCALLLLGLIARPKRAGWHAIAAALLALAVAGSSETLMLPVAMVTAAWLLAAAMGRLGWSGFGLAVAAAIAVGAAAMVLAPGNAIRAAQFSEHAHELARSLTHATVRGARYFLRWSASPALLGASLLFAAPLCACARRYRLRVGVGHVVGLVVLLAVASFPPYWAMGSGPPARARAAIWMVFAAGWFFVVVPSLARFSATRGWTWAPTRRATVGAALVAVGLFVPGNTLAALSDLVGGGALAYSRHGAAREADLRAAAGTPATRVAPHAARPRMLFVEDFSPEPGDWRNGGPAAWYRIGEVAARRPE